MASASSPAKNAAGNSNLAAEFSRLLQNSAGLEPITAALRQAAKELSRLGIISFEERTYVRCALPEDRDKPQPIVKTPQEVGGLFVMEIGPKTVCINGVEVIAAQARTAYGVMQVLVTAFVQDLLAGNAPSGFLCQSPAEITDQLQKDKRTTDAVDEDVIRRTINRLQENVETRLRKAGFAAERDSIIQVSPNAAKEGYRLNPFMVAIRPLCPADPQN